MNRRGVMEGGRTLRIVRDTLIVAGCTLATGLLLKAFLVGAFVVPTRSMESTLVPGDFVLVNRLAYSLTLPHCLPFLPSSLDGRRLVTFSSPRRGDILAFVGGASGPGCRRPTFLKRCVGVPGDTLLLEGTRLRLHGWTLERTRATAVARSQSIVLPRAGEQIALTPLTAEMFRPLIEDDGHALVIEQGAVRVDGRLSEVYRVSQDAYFVLGDNRSSSLDSRVFGVVPAGRVLGKAFLVYWSRAEAGQPDGFSHPFAGVRWTRIGTLLQ